MAINSNTNNKCCSIALDVITLSIHCSFTLSKYTKNTDSCPLHLFYRTYWKSFLFTFLESFDFQINLFSRTDRWLYFKTCLRIISSLLSILTFPLFLFIHWYIRARIFSRFSSVFLALKSFVELTEMKKKISTKCMKLN